MQFYYLKTPTGEGLHYIGGSLFYSTMDSVDEILEVTRFYTVAEAEEFRTTRLPGHELTVGRVTLRVENAD